MKHKFTDTIISGGESTQNDHDLIKAPSVGKSFVLRRLFHRVHSYFDQWSNLHDVTA